jgi:hypothetical protein
MFNVTRRFVEKKRPILSKKLAKNGALPNNIFIPVEIYVKNGYLKT